METDPTRLPALVEQETKVKLLALARDLALNILTPEQTLEKHQIDTEEYEKIVNIPFFKQALEAETAAWQSAKNTPERIKIEAAATLEDWLPYLDKRMRNSDEDLGKVIEGGKLLKSLAGINENAGAQASGEKFLIQINLGKNEVLKFERDNPPLLEAVQTTETENGDQRKTEKSEPTD